MSQATSFTPSELVLLLGNHFAGPGSLTQGKEDLLTGAGTVSINGLAESVIAVTLLALEQAGDIRLEHDARRALFGLMKKEVVAVKPTGARAAWPAGTLEAGLLATIQQGRAEVSEVVYRWLEADRKWPRAAVLAEIKDGMAARGLLERTEKRTLKIIVTHTDSLPESTRQRLAAESPQPLLSLLESARARGDLFPTLEKQIRAGLNRRQESDDD